MTLHFFDAHIYPLAHPGTGIQFLYQAVEYDKPDYIRIEMSQSIKMLVDSGQKKRLMQQAFGVAIDLIKTTWSISGLLPIGKIPYRERVEFRLTRQASTDWKNYSLTLSD